MQAVPVGLSGLTGLGCDSHWGREAICELRDIVKRGKGRGWMQKRDNRGDSIEVDIFIKSQINMDLSRDQAR